MYLFRDEYLFYRIGTRDCGDLIGFQFEAKDPRRIPACSGKVGL